MHRSSGRSLIACIEGATGSKLRLMTARIILHGKQGANEELRGAVQALRGEKYEVDVRVTWEGGDAGTLAAEASRAGFERIIAGGGDGSVNEVLNGLLDADFQGVMGVLPLGTANDFARSAGISLTLVDALRTALAAEPVKADVGRAGDRAFLNVATGGFGTEVTVSTDPRLKKALGGAAYFLTGVSRFAAIQPAPCKARSPDGDWEGQLLVLGVCNGRQAGGGHILSPSATINDGLLDVAILPYLPEIPVHEAVGKLMSRGPEALEDIAVRWRVPWVEIETEKGMTVNLDGEPVAAELHRFEVEAGRLQLAVPADSPLLAR